MKLSDGTILSSAFRAAPTSMSHGFDHIKKATSLKIGTIIAVRNVDSSEGLQKSANQSSEGQEGSPYETVYDVRVDDNNARPFIFNGCRALKPFMGANNYFEVIHEGANLSPTYNEQGLVSIFTAAAESMVGSRCVILCIEGEPTAPVILGFLQHPGRTSLITEDMGLHMQFEFNGFKCMIDKDGAFTIEANGPYIDAIAPPVGAVPDSSIRANPLIGPWMFSLDADMNLSIKDNKNQEIRVSRSDGEMEITNGTESIKLIGSLVPKQGKMLINVGGALTIASTDTVMRADKSFQINTPYMSLNADVQFAIKTGNFDLKADLGFSVKSMSASFKVKTAFVAEALSFSFKGATGELLAIIAELINGLGGLTAASPTGPCAPLLAAPQWAQVQAALVKLQGMTG